MREFGAAKLGNFGGNNGGEGRSDLRADRSGLGVAKKGNQAIAAIGLVREGIESHGSEQAGKIHFGKISKEQVTVVRGEFGQGGKPKLRKFDSLAIKIGEPATLSGSKPVEYAVFLPRPPATGKPRNGLGKIELGNLVSLRFQGMEQPGKGVDHFVFAEQAGLFPADIAIDGGKFSFQFANDSGLKGMVG